ncbi:hypothetical protein Q8W71_26525 [Methylobacterium sp. NEAU 140]|uniref:hypothetical protein n=1 Tax=Methylobacterium sp. NEAU 140 TaxID=3064945 RepID=UPI00273756C9|nr:hypothetical protein [Methylobacterium sp. NEAU 140]MDP4026186.1 hypothetical protein [Methylobacterium sp. NEAU 140]
MSDATTVELFRNAEWSVQPDGLEHSGTGYFIDRAVLAARRAERLWDWPLQMAEKRWCRPSLFREAFLAALDRFGIERDADLTRSFALGYGIRAVDGPVTEGFAPLADLLCPREAAVPAPVPRPARALAAAGA